MLETINQRIRYYRNLRKYSQSYVAKQLKIKTSTYSQMEREGNITCKMLLALTEILEIDALTLLYGERAEDRIVLPECENTNVPIDAEGIPPLLASDIYEKFAVLAMRNFPPKRKLQLYQFILDEFKYIDNLRYKHK